MQNKELPPNRIQALRFAMWIGMVSIVMLFGAFTSAYLVRKPVGNWYEFKLPVQFFYSTIIIVLSSVSLELAYKNFKNQASSQYKIYLTISFLLGIAFLISQAIAFQYMMGIGLFIDLNVSVSFLYVIAGMHGLHVLGGIIAIIITMLVAFTTNLQVTEFKILKFDLLRQYWHFIGVLWIYLLVFLILQ
ncbi:MAG: cytochrome c oxidase subunit 3 [Saprospiraceae bacterium]